MFGEFGNSLFFIFLAVLDGLKSLVECYFHQGKEKSRKETPKEEVTALIAAYNEAEIIVKTLKSVKRHFSKIILIDDGSSDGTAIIAQMAKLDVRIIRLEKNVGKAAALKIGLEEVDTPYVIYFDADISLLENFSVPDMENCTAASFNIIPEGDKLVNDIQKYEYAKAMASRQFLSQEQSVSCVSGAAGIFRTERSRQFGQFHTDIFCGEDLERTLIELANGGKIIFSKSKVKTCVPDSWLKLCRQRITGWWPGLWRSLPLFIKLAVKRKISSRLRIEMIYQTISTILDPAKLLSLLVLITLGQWQPLVIIYALYLGFEFVIKFFIKPDLSRPYLTVVLMPLYAVLQMILKNIALAVFIVKRFKKEWRPVVISFGIAMVAMFVTPELSFARDKTEWIIAPGYEFIKDSNGNTQDNATLYLGWKSYYFDGVFSEAEMRRGEIGGYFKIKSFALHSSLQMRPDMSATTLYFNIEKQIAKGLVGKIGAKGLLIENNEDKLLPILGAGYYFGDSMISSLDFYQTFDYKNRKTLPAAQLKNRIIVWKIKWDIGGFIDGESDWGAFTNLGLGPLTVGYSYTPNFEKQGYTREQINIGFQYRF